ncbi:choice-of-anchor I family protein [Bremerella sp. T1]|uniref:choice-of-anchor I family protein n=1 Tax=Bremerella sp. TYQ1 TaxID=3119568 RepID=UPI001CC9B153|nr:choice-of-anchor I family protein [Bremerella volcania]UBM38334.1 choice-of-anchor I family protein [Bremerella volcania]
MKLLSVSGAILASLMLAGTAFAGPLDFLFGTPALEEAWRYTAAGGEGASEIAAFDASTQKVFVTNAVDGTVDVLDASTGSLLEQIEAGDVNSVACYEGLVAIAIAAEETGVRGKVMLVDANNYSILAEPEAGFLPDMVTFTPNGRYVLVANEGEPNDDYDVDPVGSISIIDVRKPGNPKVFEAGFESFNGDEAALKAAGVRIFGPGASVAQDLEPEYIAVSADSRTAYVSCQENNAVAVVSISAKKVLSVNPLGYKDHTLAENAMDASNRDEGINIQTWPTKGMYQPDAISSTRFLGFTLIASANEGDARDYDGFSEEERVKDLVLDEEAFPDAELLQEDENLGRLNSTLATGDLDGDGDHDEIYSYGARSFSLWLFTPFGETIQIYDSGNDFETITAALVPDYFNSQEGDIDEFDSRSDDKGPEPEAIDVGNDLGSTWAFIGMERVGGVMLYDITNPIRPEFVEYSRNLIDAGPEGIDYVSRGDSPFTEPAIVVSHEISGTTTMFRIKRTGGLLSGLLND